MYPLPAPPDRRQAVKPPLVCLRYSLSCRRTPMRGYRSCPADAQPTGGALSHRILPAGYGSKPYPLWYLTRRGYLTPAQPPLGLHVDQQTSIIPIRLSHLHRQLPGEALLTPNSPGDETNLTQKQP